MKTHVRCRSVGYTSNLIGECILMKVCLQNVYYKSVCSQYFKITVKIKVGNNTYAALQGDCKRKKNWWKQLNHTDDRLLGGSVEHKLTSYKRKLKRDGWWDEGAWKKSDKDELFNQVWAERIFEVAPILLIR